MMTIATVKDMNIIYITINGDLEKLYKVYQENRNDTVLMGAIIDLIMEKGIDKEKGWQRLIEYFTEQREIINRIDSSRSFKIIDFT